MKKLISIAAMLTLAATIGSPFAAQAQSDATAQSTGSSMSGAHHGRHHRDPFFRALKKLTLADDQKKQIKSDVAATKQANKDATPDQRKANMEKLRRQIEALLTPAQQQQLKAESAAQKAKWEAHKGTMTPEPTSTY
jgi:Spy/CpxP family protein refolding chaperone